MNRIINISRERASQLNRRSSLEVELPEWLIRVLQLRVAEANEGATDDEVVGLNEVVEWCLAAPITLRDVPAYEAAIPGVTAALTQWLEESTYDPYV